MRTTTANGGGAMEEARLKENVNPVGGGLLGPSRRERKLGRLGAGAGLGAQEKDRSSKHRVGVLAPNSTLGNCGGVEALEWLKDRVSQHKLVSKSYQAEADSGSRHLRKLVSPAVDDNEKIFGALGKPSAVLSSSKELGGTVAGREQHQSFVSHPSPSSHSKALLSHLRNSVDHGGEKNAKNHRFGSGAKSPWPASNRGVIEIYQDNSLHSQDHHRDVSRKREVSIVKPVEIKSSPAASLFASEGLALRSELEEHSKLSSLNSPSNVFLSKFQLQQDHVDVKKLSSPQQQSSHNAGSGLWSGSRRQGTPYKSIGVHQSRESVVDRPERSSNSDQQQFRISGESAQSASTLQAGLGGSSKWSRRSAIWSQAEADAHHSPSEQEILPQDDRLKWNTSSNIDSTVPGHGSARLSLEGTGASSSGSSVTPCLTGNSSLEDDTLKSREPTSLADKAICPANRLSNVYNKLSKINKRSRSLGPASRVLRDSIESCNSRISPVSVAPIIESDCFDVTTAEEVEKNSGGQLEHPSSDPRKRKAERDPSSGDGDTSQIFEQSSSAPAAAQQKDTEVAVQPQRQSAQGTEEMGSMPRECPSHLLSKQDVGNFARPHLPIKLVSRPTKLQQPSISATGKLVQYARPSSVPTTSKASTGALARRQSSTPPARNRKEMDASESNKSDRRHPHGREGAEMKPSSVRECSFPVNKPVYGTQNANDKTLLLSIEAPASLENGRDLADMSLDGLSFAENKENIPIPVVPDLSNCLNSLSLGGEDMLKKDENKLRLSDSDRVSQIPSVAPSSQSATLKSVENSRATPSMSHSARSVTSFRDQVRISPSGSENPQEDASVAKLARRSPVLSENPGGELSNKAVGLPHNTEVRTVPSEGAQVSGASALQSSHGVGKENGRGATATSQKMSENLNFVWVNDKRYQKLGKIGKGGSSEVFKVIDSDCNIYAMKKINLRGREHRAALGFYQEIEYLERLQGKRNVIQLIDYEVTNRSVVREDYEEEKISEDAFIYMVLEFGEIDLAGILSKKRKEMMESDEIIDDNWLRFYWKHMLLAVKTIHDERIVHADLKPANFLLVKGELKLIDFGIAKAIQNDTTHIVRDSQVGTLNYMSPEAFMTNSIDEEGQTVKCGRSSDIWSLGCILYQMVYGHTPFSQVDSFYAKIQAITSKSHKIQFLPIPDPWLLDVMKKCLTWDRYSRPHIANLLEHPFLRPELANQQKWAA